MDKNNKSSYDGWIVSENIFKRSLAIYGYSLLGGLIIIIPIMILLFFIGLLVGMMTIF